MFEAVGIDSTDLVNYRPYRDATFVATTIYVSTLGSDLTGDGSQVNPYATIAKAVSTVPISQASTVVIQLVGAGPYDLPTAITQYNNITIRGEETITDTRAISSVASTSTTNGIVFTLGGAALTLNQLKGSHLHVTGVLSGSRNIIVGYNTAANVCSGVMHNRTFLSSVQSSPAGGSVDIVSYTQLVLTGTTIQSSSVNFALELVRVTGSFSYFALATEKLNAWKTIWNNTGIQSGRAGGIYLHSSTVATIGSSTAGLMSIRNGGDFRLGYGTLITDTNAGASNAFVSGSSGSIFTIEEGCVFSNLDAKGIELDSVNMSFITQTNLKMLFETWSGAASCAAGFRINKNGGAGIEYSLPQANGGVLSNYYVDATSDAFVKVGASTSVTTATVTNAVSADNGVTAVALAADGTRIEGGVPLLTGVLIPQEEYTITHSATAANLINSLGIGISGLASSIILKGIADYTPPILGNNLSELFIPICFPFLDGDLIVTEENALPVGSVQIYGKVNMAPDAIGSGRKFITLYAETAGTFEDEYGRVYHVYDTTTPALNPEMFPLYVNPANTGALECVTCPGLDEGFVSSFGSGYFALRGSANTLPLYLDPAAADKTLALFYDNAGTGVDLTIPSGYTGGGSGSPLFSPAGVTVSLDMYFDENQTNVSKRWFHRSPFFTSTIYLPISYSGKVLEVQYDATSALGVPVYIDGSGFPGSLKANLPSAVSKTFKTCATRKLYQSNLD